MRWGIKSTRFFFFVDRQGDFYEASLCHSLVLWFSLFGTHGKPDLRNSPQRHPELVSGVFLHVTNKLLKQVQQDAECISFA